MRLRKPLTVDEVHAEVERVRAHAGEPQLAHELEDRLHHRVLQAIAAGRCLDSAGCARAAMQTVLIEFVRWD